jgi:hypothetical protein
MYSLSSRTNVGWRRVDGENTPRPNHVPSASSLGDGILNLGLDGGGRPFEQRLPLVDPTDQQARETLVGLFERRPGDPVVPIDRISRIICHQIEHNVLAVRVDQDDLSFWAHSVEDDPVIRFAELAVFAFAE